jgi:hypothetical protein
VQADGHRALSGGDRVMQLWDVDSGKELRRFKGHTDHLGRGLFCG